MKVHPDLDDLNGLLDVHDARAAVDAIGHQNVAVPELIVIIFDVHGPMTRERPIHAAAHGPAVAIVQPLKVEGPTVPMR